MCCEEHLWTPRTKEGTSQDATKTDRWASLLQALSYIANEVYSLTSVGETTEDLQNRLKDQGEDPSTATQSQVELISDQAPSPDIDNEDVTDEGYQEVGFASMDSSVNLQAQFGDMQCWSPSIEDMSIENLHPNLMFPGLLTEHQHALAQNQIPPHASLEIGVHPNLMICADL